jgi:hypothetical protein
MKRKKIFKKLDDTSSFRLSLNYCCSIMNYPAEIYNNKDPILNLLNNSENKDMKYIINNNKKEKITKYFYFNKTAVHNFLYKENEVIKLFYDSKNNNLEFYFYLTLLIRENTNILNYEYDEDYIIKLNEENKNNNNKLNQLIKSKLIIELTNEYKLDNDYYDDPKGKELDKIINININNIKNNLNILLNLNIKLNINEIINLPIDEIYIQIIIGLINSKKFGEYEFVIDIINQLSLEEIDLTKLMYNEIKSFLDDEKNKNLLNDYKLQDEKDLNNDIKVNFNFILIKYILKNIFDIYDIKFVYDLRNSLKNILKNSRNSINNCEKSIYIKIKYILNNFSLQPQKFIKNNLKKYYDNYLSGNISKNIEKTGEIKHGDLNVVEYLKQIFDVKEYREEYKTLSKNEKDFKSLVDKLANIEDSYSKKILEILKNEEIKNYLISGNDLSPKILKDLFIFKSFEDDKLLQEIENKLGLLGDDKKIETNETAIKYFENWPKDNNVKTDKDNEE